MVIIGHRPSFVPIFEEEESMRAASLTLLACLFLPKPVPAGQETVASNADDLSWIEKRVDEWKAGPSDRKFDQVGWLTDLLSAQKLAKEHGRPIFLFTHDGRMAIGRC